MFVSRFYVASLTYNNNRYVYGGQTVGGSRLERIYAYNILANEWETIQPGGISPTAPVSNHTCVHRAEENAFYFFGGTTNAFHRFDIGKLAHICSPLINKSFPGANVWGPVKSRAGYCPWRQDHVAVVYNDYMWVTLSLPFPTSQHKLNNNNCRW